MKVEPEDTLRAVGIVVLELIVVLFDLAVPSSRPVPEGYIRHTESTTSILFAIPTPKAPRKAPTASTSASNAAANPTLLTPAVFLNPVQEYNRDLSIVAIRTWSEERQREKNVIWEEGLRKRWAKEKEKKRKVVVEAEAEGGDTKRRKVEDGSVVEVEDVEMSAKAIVSLRRKIPH